MRYLNSRGLGFMLLVAALTLAGMGILAISHWISTGTGFRHTRLTGMRTNALFLAESAVQEAMYTIRTQVNASGSIYNHFRSGSNANFDVPVPRSSSLASGTGLTVKATARYRPTQYMTRNAAPGSSPVSPAAPHESCGLLLVRGHVQHASGSIFSGHGGIVVKRWVDIRTINTRYSPLTRFALYIRNAQRQFQRDIPSYASLPRAFNRYELGFSVTGDGGDVLLGSGSSSEGRIYLDMPQGSLANEVGEMMKSRSSTRRIEHVPGHKYPTKMNLAPNSEEWRAWADSLRQVYNDTLFKVTVKWKDFLGNTHTDVVDAYMDIRDDAHYSDDTASGHPGGFSHYYNVLGLIGEYEPSDTGDPNHTGTYTRHLPYFEQKARVPFERHVATSIVEARDTGKQHLPLNLDWGNRDVFGLGTRRAFLYSSIYMRDYTVEAKGQSFTWDDGWYFQYPLYFDGVENNFEEPHRTFVHRTRNISSALFEVDMTPGNSGNWDLQMQAAPTALALDGSDLWRMEIGAGIYTNKQSLIFRDHEGVSAAEAFRSVCVDGSVLVLNGIARVYDDLDLGQLNITSYRGQGILIANSIVAGTRPFQAEGADDFMMLVARGTAAMNSGPPIMSNTPRLILGSQPIEAMLVAIGGDGTQATLGVRGNGIFSQHPSSSSGVNIMGGLSSSVVGALISQTNIHYDKARLHNRHDDRDVVSVSLAGRSTGWLTRNE